jgi:N-acetylglucosaminyldiphosphoundecaprenol N-acetyl-beta-D-mannosaminyltransferase
MRIPTVNLRGEPIHAITERDCVSLILERHQAGDGGWVVTHNLDHLRRLGSDRDFAGLCRSASLRVADGMPLIWASKMQGGRALPERVAGSSLIYSLTEAGDRAGCSFYFLGGNAGTAAKTASVLAARYVGLRVAGTECPPVGFDQDADYLRSLAARLTAAAPDIVYVALGSPKQEQLIGKLVESLPRAWFIGVGVSFSFVAGEIRRAPRWMQQAGLEWLHRLIQEPVRLSKRYMIDGMRTALVLFTTCLTSRYFAGRTVAAEAGDLPTKTTGVSPRLLRGEVAADEGFLDVDTPTI